MFTVKYQFGQVDEYVVYECVSYTVRPMEIPVPTDEQKKLGKKGVRTGRMRLSIQPNRGDDPFDIFTDKGHMVYVMNAAGQTIDIIHG